MVQIVTDSRLCNPPRGVNEPRACCTPALAQRCTASPRRAPPLASHTCCPRRGRFPGTCQSLHTHASDAASRMYHTHARAKRAYVLLHWGWRTRVGKLGAEPGCGPPRLEQWGGIVLQHIRIVLRRRAGRLHGPGVLFCNVTTVHSADTLNSVVLPLALTSSDQQRAEAAGGAQTAIPACVSGRGRTPVWHNSNSRESDASGH